MSLRKMIVVHGIKNMPKSKDHIVGYVYDGRNLEKKGGEEERAKS